MVSFQRPATDGEDDKQQLTLFLVVLFLVNCFAHPATAGEMREGGPTLVIRGGTLIDGTGAAPRENGLIVLGGKRILSISQDPNQPIPEAVRVIDAQGKYILPGLIDGHMHYSGSHALLYLSNGVTSVIDTGMVIPWIYVQKWAIAEGLVPGPRIFTAGPQLNSPPEYHASKGGGAILIENVDAARAATRQVIGDGADLIKVYKNLRPELIRAIVEEADLRGIPVAGHLAISAREAVLLGVDSLEHATGIPIDMTTDEEKLSEVGEKGISDDLDYMVQPSSLRESFSYMQPKLFPGLIDFLIENGTSVTPTLLTHWMGLTGFEEEYEKTDRAFLADPVSGFLPEYERRWVLRTYDYFGVRRGPTDEQGYKNLQLFLTQFAQAGGKIVAGTDTIGSVIAGVSIHRELELLVAAGLTPMQALLAATRHAAEKVRKWDEIGSVESGKYADLLILDMNPLENIRNTRKIHMVIQNGVVLDTTLDPNFVDLLPRPGWDEEFLEFFEGVLFKE